MLRFPHIFTWRETSSASKHHHRPKAINTKPMLIPTIEIYYSMASKNIRFPVMEKGTPLVATTAEKPQISEPNEVIIRLKAIAINPADFKMIDQGARGTSWPLVAGMDGSGIVEAASESVKNVAIGDEVLACFTPGDRSGSYQTFAVVQNTMVAKKPTSWSFEDAATLGCVPNFLSIRSHMSKFL